MFLGIETATPCGSVALQPAGGRVVLRRLEKRAAHALDLITSIEALLADSALAPTDLQGIAVATGPGSFTGVRVGMATAKGMAYALDIPVAGLSTLEAMARAVAAISQDESSCLCPVLSAGRGELYAALFEVRSGALLRRSRDRIWLPAALRAQLPEGVLIIGEGVASAERTEAALGSRGVVEAPPLAQAIASWAAAVISPGGGYRPGLLTPNYVRPTDAEAARRRT